MKLPTVLPEVRGSHLAAQLERERAMRVLANGNRHHRRAAKKQRKAAASAARRNLKETMSMQQQNIPEPAAKKSKPAAKRAYSKRAPVRLDCHAELAETCSRVPMGTLAESWVDLGLYARNKSLPRATAVVNAATTIGRHLHDPSLPCLPSVVESFRKLIAHFAARASAASVAIETPASVPANATDQRIDRLENLVNRLVDAIASGVPSVPQIAKGADVVPLRPREQVYRIIKDASSGDSLYRERWNKLYSDFEFSSRYNFRARATALKIDSEADGWRLKVAEDDGVIGDLLSLAKSLFAAEAARHKG